jgi:hypothetical protein
MMLLFQSLMSGILSFDAALTVLLPAPPRCAARRPGAVR